jgi:hypothetical protein
MKRILTYVLIILVFGTIFGISLQGVNHNLKEDAPAISAVLEYITPAVAYADSDTVTTPWNPPPPPPID